MKPLPLFLLLSILLMLTIVLETLLPAMPFSGEAHLVLFPMIFSFAVLVLPFSGALFFAVMTGLIEGLLVMQIENEHVEIKLGWFIFFFVSWALIIQSISDITTGVRWELHALSAGFLTATFLLGEFFFLTFARGNFLITQEVFFLCFVPAGFSFLLAPLCYWLLQFLLSRPPYIGSTYLSPL
jgi:hypothetical protein